MKEKEMKPLVNSIIGYIFIVVLFASCATHNPTDSFKDSIEAGKIEDIKDYIKENKNNIHEKGHHNWTLLMYAAKYNQLELAQFLIDNGADLNAHIMYNGSNALELAVNFSHEEMAELLLKNGAFFQKHYAYTNGDLKMIRFLISKGYDLNTKSNIGETAMLYAARGGKIEAINLLLENGADIDVVTNYHCTPLSYALYKKQYKAAKLLITNGADINKGKIGLQYLLERDRVEQLQKDASDQNFRTLITSLSNMPTLQNNHFFQVVNILADDSSQDKSTTELLDDLNAQIDNMNKNMTENINTMDKMINQNKSTNYIHTQNKSNYNYKSNSGQIYQYDMNNGNDRLKYSTDIDAQQRDMRSNMYDNSANIDRQRDGAVGQSGGGIYGN